MKRSVSSKATVMQALFSDCASLEKVNFDNFSTRSVQEIDYLFEDCSSLTSLDLSGLDSSAVTNTYCMFSGCSSLKEVDLNNFSTSVTSSGMFSGCTAGLTVYVSDEEAKAWCEARIGNATNITVVIGKMP